MNPVVSLQTTPVLPIFPTNSLSAVTVSSLVVIAFTISTSFMITGGLKKCSPATLSGRRVAAAISTIVRLDVFDLLDDRLDDQVAILEVGERGRAAKPSARRLRVVFGRSAALDETSERSVDALEALVDERLVDLAHERIEARLRADLRDARTHLTEADDADALNSHLDGDLLREPGQHMTA